MKKHGPWTIKSSERLYKDKFVEFWVDEVVKPSGEESRYATGKMLPGVSVLALDAEGFVHLTKQFRYAVGKDSVEVVSGGLDDGEEEREAALRELKEELGIEAGELTDLGMVDAVTSQVSAPARVFLARELVFGEPDRGGSEVMETLKVSLDEAVRMVMAGEITHAISCVLILKTKEVLSTEC
jgi:8-oxo-dGTP pyrophosphatase MutT (NUDIX family)